MGYLGMIHNFKNAVLRKDLQYLERAETNTTYVLELIDQIQQLNLTPDESVWLLMLDDTVLNYQQQFKIIRSLIKQSASAEEIDRQVRVDDMNAALVLNSFRLSWEKSFEELEQRQEDALRELETYTRIGAYSSPLFILLAVGFVWFLYRYIGVFQLTKKKVGKSEAFISDVIDSSAEAIITINGKGKIIVFNPAAEKLFGYSADEAINKDVSILMPVDERSAHRGYVENSELYTTRIIHQARELEGQRKDGTRFPMELNVSRMIHHDEPHFIGVCHDITARKKIENEYKTAQLAAEEARVNAEKANQAKSQFLSSMSHELRTPLNAIIGFSQIVKIDGEGNLTEDQAKNINEIEKAGQHLLELINNVLDLSRIESGRFDLKIGPVLIGDLLSQCASIISPQLEKYRVNFNYAHEQCNQVIVHTDQLRLKQVILNLLTNACKYNKPGGTVDVKCELGNDILRISVIDTGIGINESEINDLFEPFNRMGAECGQIEGTGIGLNITLKMVELLGGTLGVDSAPGEGAHFWIDLPVNYHE